MKENQERDFGCDYILALCSSIEKVTQDVWYNDVNLRYALERALYFSHANNDHLFEIFTEWKTDTLPEKIQAKDDVERKLIASMLGIDIDRIYIRKSSRTKTIIKDFVRICLNILRLGYLASFVRKEINASNQDKYYDVLFYAINERFARFMKPIFDKMPVSCAYLTHDKKTADYLEKEKIPFVKISRFWYILNRFSQKNSWIRRFMLLEHYDILEDTLKRLRPKSVVLVEGNAAPYEVVNQICKKFGIQSVCIQQGWSPIIHNGFRNMSYSKMLVWGDGFAEDLKEFNPNQKFIVTGDFNIEERQPRDTKKIKTVALFFHGISRLINTKLLERFVEFAEELVKRYPNLKIIIREHPAYNLNKTTKAELENSENVTFMSGPKYSLESVMEKSDLNITIFSTVILESIAAGIIPLAINITSCPHFFPNFGALNAGIEVKSIEDGLKIVKNLLENPDAVKNYATPMDTFRKKYFAFHKESAVRNIIREII